MMTHVFERRRQTLGAIVILIAANAILGPAYALETATPGGETAWNWKEVTTLVIAVFGAGLGLLNTWSAINARRLHVMVRTTFAYPVIASDTPFMMGIEVINFSAFAVTINEVGVTLQGTTDRAASSRPQVLDDKPWPRRLEARDAVSTYVQPPLDSKFPVRAAYARLASGEVVTGRGKVVKALRAEQARASV